ncbi:MAG: hypothetical protein ACREIQ_07160, partial [Nitrospiria bacterium]
MQRKVSEAEVGQLIRSLGGDWKKFEDRRYCPHCHQLIYRIDNQPFDGIGVIGGRAFPVEVKAAEKSFAFSEIMDHQRTGLSDWQSRHQSPAWLALQMGITIKHKETPRKMWLVRWNDWLEIEGMFRELNVKSMPYSDRTTKLVVLRNLGFNAVFRLADYELYWLNGEWHLPKSH